MGGKRFWGRFRFGEAHIIGIFFVVAVVMIVAHRARAARARCVCTTRAGSRVGGKRFWRRFGEAHIFGIFFVVAVVTLQPGPQKVGGLGSIL